MAGTLTTGAGAAEVKAARARVAMRGRELKENILKGLWGSFGQVRVR